MRLFVSVEPPAAEKARLAAAVAGWRQALGGRWTKSEQWHLTLAFLGEIDSGRLAALEAAIASAAGGSARFSARIAGAGMFPMRRPRVAWLGLEPAAAFRALGDGLRSRLHGAGFLLEDRALIPHLTLVRARESFSPAEIELWKEATARLPPGPEWPVDGVCLMRSHLGAGGARHERLAAYTLGPSGAR